MISLNSVKSSSILFPHLTFWNLHCQNPCVKWVGTHQLQQTKESRCNAPLLRPPSLGSSSNITSSGSASTFGLSPIFRSRSISVFFAYVFLVLILGSSFSVWMVRWVLIEFEFSAWSLRWLVVKFLFLVWNMNRVLKVLQFQYEIWRGSWSISRF